MPATTIPAMMIAVLKVFIIVAFDMITLLLRNGYAFVGVFHFPDGHLPPA